MNKPCWSRHWRTNAMYRLGCCSKPTHGKSAQTSSGNFTPLGRVKAPAGACQFRDWITFPAPCAASTAMFLKWGSLQGATKVGQETWVAGIASPVCSTIRLPCSPKKLTILSGNQVSLPGNGESRKPTCPPSSGNSSTTMEETSA